MIFWPQWPQNDIWPHNIYVEGLKLMNMNKSYGHAM